MKINISNKIILVVIFFLFISAIVIELVLTENKNLLLSIATVIGIFFPYILVQFFLLIYFLIKKSEIYILTHWFVPIYMVITIYMSINGVLRENEIEIERLEQYEKSKEEWDSLLKQFEKSKEEWD